MKDFKSIIILFMGASLILGAVAMHNGYSFNSVLDTHFMTFKLEAVYPRVP